MPFAQLLPVRQAFEPHEVGDIPATVRAELAASGMAAKLKPGGRVAIGVGSRGISNLAEIVRAAVDFWKEQGMRPFIVPAMGSHGAATPEGQADVLAHYGVTESAMGCPVISSLEVVSTGTSPEGIATVMDRQAFESDGVMLVSRVKWHTDFEAPIESGVFKMMAIGLGKFAGAQRYHSHAFRIGLAAMVLSVGRQILRTGKILGGLAIVEDAYHNTGILSAVRADELETREPELLALAKAWKGRLLPPEIDILIVDELGKDVSGSGMDTKIINRHPNVGYNPWPDSPRIHRILARDLSADTYGNAVGIGLADAVHDRLLSKVDWAATNVNVFTSGVLGVGFVPFHFPTDRECLDVLARTVGKPDPRDVTFAWIRNTLELEGIMLSANLRPVIEADRRIEVVGPPLDFPFDAKGDLPGLPVAAAARA